jgi:hypothetical protein
MRRVTGAGVKKKYRDFYMAMVKAGWEPIKSDDGTRFDRWRYRTNGKVIWHDPAYLNWEGGDIEEVPF